ncbi:MAG: excinuclease ABC subunit UvrA [Cellulosilyticaceae bacterium]
MKNFVSITGIREHNFKNENVTIPHHKHTVLVGVSGSGKSTLAYDVIYAAGQRRLLDCLSDQVKRYTKQMRQPDIDHIDGLVPVVSIKKQRAPINPRSTVGTITEMSAYMRTLFSVLGRCSCPECEAVHETIRLNELIHRLETRGQNKKYEVSFEVYLKLDLELQTQLETFKSNGFRWVIVEGMRQNLRDWVSITDRSKPIRVVVGTVTAEEVLSKRSINILKNAVSKTDGRIVIEPMEDLVDTELEAFYETYSCPVHYGFWVDVIPNTFSFNDLRSSCQDCMGSGIKRVTHPDLVIQNPHKPINKGAFYSYAYNITKPYAYMELYSLAKHYGFSWESPYSALSQEVKDILLYGIGSETFTLLRPEGYTKALPNYRGKEGEQIGFGGILTWIEQEYKKRLEQPLTQAEEEYFQKCLTDIECPTCKGSRIKPSRNQVRLLDKTFFEVGEMELNGLQQYISQIHIPDTKKDLVTAVLNELKARIAWLIQIGLGYLNFNRRTDSLSGGEYQRLRLAGQLSSDLMGLMYVIDEPLDGLHGYDNQKVIAIIDLLQKNGNTIITIEHDLDLIKAADHVIEIGPGSGKYGGRVIAEGTPKEIFEMESSILRTAIKAIHKTPQVKLIASQEKIVLTGVTENNLKNVDVTIPLKNMVCFTGISGSGKSSLAIEVLYKALKSKIETARIIPGQYEQISGYESIKRVYCLSQRDLSKSKTSTPVTYMKLMDPIRELFAKCPEAEALELNHIGYYSYNDKGGCPTCKGKGYTESYVHYFGDLKACCPQCNGKRYTDEVLEIKYNGKNISEVLAMDVDSAYDFFSQIPSIEIKLGYMRDLGLDYMSLGQPINTVSSGEAQRLRLAKELSRNRSKKGILYILDEPTAGLHLKDVDKVIKVLREIVGKGNSVIIIEHNPNVIIQSDYIIDMGPDAGESGGQVIYQGDVEGLLATADSKTAQYLKTFLK